MNPFKAWLWRLTWILRTLRSSDPDVGRYFPDFSLRDLHGTTHRLSDSSQHEYTALWFTNLCEDCRAKAPLLEQLRLEARGRVRILAVSLLGADTILPSRAAAGCGYPFLIDPDDIVGQNLGLPHPPQTCPLHNFFVLNKEGRILFRHHLSALKADAFREMWRQWLMPRADNTASLAAPDG